MKAQFLTLTATRGPSRPRPRLDFGGLQLRDAGFIPGALVQALPQPGGLAFYLRNQITGTYSDLWRLTNQLGGKLMQVTQSGDPQQYPRLYTTDPFLTQTALSIGDPLIAVIEPELIRIQKLPPNLKPIPAAAPIKNRAGMEVPKVRICGLWLNDYGFGINAMVTAHPEPGRITFTVRKDDNYRDTVRFAYKNNLKLLQIRQESHNRGQPVPVISVTGSCVNKAQFDPEDLFLASCSPGEITLQRLDFDKLG